MVETNEVFRARILLIKHRVAYVNYRIESGEFGTPFPTDREELQRINLKRNNLVGHSTLQILSLDLEDLTEALHSAMEDANSCKWGLGDAEADRFYELWLHFREQLPADYVPKWLR